MLSFSDLFLFGYLALLLLEALFAVIALQNRSRECPTVQGQMAFRKPLSSRITIILFSITVASWPMLIIDNVFQSHSPLLLRTWVLFVATTILSLAVGLICFRAGGPEDLLLDLEKQTYQRSTGWPLFPTAYFGTWKDMAGIYVMENGAASRVYTVGITWRAQRGKTQLGHFYSQSCAHQFADAIAEKLGLRRISLSV